MKNNNPSPEGGGNPTILSGNRKPLEIERQENKATWISWSRTHRQTNIFSTLKKKKRRGKGRFTSVGNNEVGLLELSRIRRFLENRSYQKNKNNGSQLHPPHPGDKKDC